MPEKSGFFDSTADDPREYAARDFAEYFARFVTNGVFNAGQYLNVSASGSDANVSLSPGFAWINGYVYSVYDSALTLPIQPATTQDRIDRVILRLDTSVQTRKIRALVVQGLPSASPLPPALIRSGSIFDLSLAQVRVVANSSIVLPGNITDERLDQNVCGLVNSLIKVDTAKFQKDWDDFIASVQSQGFATPSYVNQRVSVGNYGTTTNSANVYSVVLNPAPAALTEGLKVTVMINADSTGSPSLNVNGFGAKPVLKANGNPASLKKNGIYTVVYNGSSAFILQGEGSDGNATAADIRAGKTATVGTGDITGTMPNISLNGRLTAITVQNQVINIPAGYSDGTGQVTATYVNGKSYFNTFRSGGQTLNVDFGFTASAVCITNSYGSIYLIGKDYSGKYAVMGGGDYLNHPFYPTYFTGSGLKDYYLPIDGGTYEIQAWA